MTTPNSTLIPVFESQFNDATVQTVNARDLHSFLSVRRDFSTWFKDRVEKYEFVENQDFLQVIDSKAPQSSGAPKSKTYGQDKIEYHVTLDMAKELAMVERNKKGKEARQYFIAVEKAYHTKQQAIDLTREQILVMALESERERMRLAKELEAAKPMIQFHKEVTAGEGEFSIPQACKTLFDGAVTETQLRAWLKHQGWMDRRKGFNEPTVWAIRQGYMRLKLNMEVAPGIVKNYPVITPKGLTLLRHLYRTGDLFIVTIPIERRLSAPELRV